MSEHGPNRPIPRFVLIGAAALIGFSMVAVAAVRVAGGPEAEKPAGIAVERRSLRFEDGAGGAVIVVDAGNGQQVDVLPAGTNGFVRGLMRSLARDRKSNDIGAEPPFTLTRWADGGLSLEDPTTGRHVPLQAFGATNVASFARFLRTPEVKQ